MKLDFTRFDRMSGLFSLVTSLLVFGASLCGISMMVYQQYSLKWTFVCYVAASSWLLVMNVLSNMIILTAKKTVKRETRGTCRQTSINLDLLNNPDGTRYLSCPPPEMFERANNRTRRSELTSHTPPPSYEDVSQVVSEENNGESFPAGGETSNEKAMHEVLESANEMKKVREVLRGEYAKEKRFSPRDGRKSRRVSDSNQVHQNPGDENARRILHKRIEERRNHQLDRRLEGNSLKKMNEYCMRDLKRDLERKSSDLTPKESLRRNLKAKYGHSADNLIDFHSSRDSVSSSHSHQFRNIELPRVHAKSTQSLKLPSTDSSSQGSVRSSGGSTSGLSLQDVHVRGSQPDIRTANEIGLPMDRTWKQKPVKLPDRATANVNLDSSFSLKHLDDRKRLDANPCGRSKSMPGRQRSREKEDEHARF